MTCNHSNTEFYGYTRSADKYTVTKLCCECLDQIDHEATEHEIELIIEYSSKNNGLHDVVRSFIDNVLNQPAYKLQLADQWVKDHLEDARIIFVDDENHMTSILVLIDHKTPTKFMGTSVYFIDQQDNVSKFFMYPRSMKKLNKVLTELYNNFNKVDELTQERYLRFHTAMNSG